jgi:hypothetical protein
MKRAKEIGPSLRIRSRMERMSGWSDTLSVEGFKS